MASLHPWHGGALWDELQETLRASSSMLYAVIAILIVPALIYRISGYHLRCARGELHLLAFNMVAEQWHVLHKEQGIYT